ncbi:MAG TPA: hypothetical protein VGG39_09435 [Polyangiaceae bacterium]
MRLFAVALVFAPAALAVVACENPDANQGATAPTATSPYGAYPPPGYPPGYGQPGYPQQPGYAPTAAPGYTAQPYPAPGPAPYPAPTAAPPNYPAPAPAPGPAPGPPPAPAGSSSMSAPGPLALPCQNDTICGTHHCNTQYGKCAFPCQSAADCVAPNACTMGICAPALPGAPTGH